MSGFELLEVRGEKTIEEALTKARDVLKREAPNAISVYIKLIGVEMDLMDITSDTYLFEYKLKFQKGEY